jgi:hyperosmotically inducible protein
MIRRLFSVLVLVALVGVIVYFLQQRAPGAPSLAAEARQIGAEAREKLGAAGREVEDAKITASVKTALELTRSLRPYAFAVSTDDRVVTLRGQTDGEALRAQAVAVATRVPGVARVVSEIEATPAAVPPPGSTGGRTLGEKLDDGTLAVRVKLALSLNRDLEGSHLSVTAYTREVTLRGDVTSRAQHDLALQTVADTDGVEKVIDQIGTRQ